MFAREFYLEGLVGLTYCVKINRMEITTILRKNMGMLLRKNRRSLLFLVVILVFTLVVVCFIWPELQRIQFMSCHLNIMKNCDSSETKSVVRSWFERDYNFTEIYDWVHEKLEFVPFNESFENRHTNPVEILESSKGRCGEFSILYVAACLAHGYQCRSVVSIDVSNPISWRSQHAWAEVKLDNQWIHVDPSERKWNKPSMYKNWSWEKTLGLT